MLVAREVTAGDTIETAGMAVRLFAQDHGRIQSLGLRIGAFAYSTDVVALDDAAFAALAGVDTWVVGCFLRQGPHWTHADLPTVLDWVARVQPRRAVLTHMGTDMDWAWLARAPAARRRGRLRRHGAGRHAGCFHGRQPGSCRISIENNKRTLRTTRISIRTGVPSGR